LVLLLTTYHGAQMTVGYKPVLVATLQHELPGGLKVYDLRTAMGSDFSVRKK
jgi:hypothetical protein